MLRRGMMASSTQAYSYWNPSDKSSAAALSDSNKVVTSTASATSWVRSVTSKNSGKWRVQFVDTNHIDTIGFGFSTSGSIGSYLGGTAAGWCLYGNYTTAVRMYNNNVYTSYTSTLATNDVIDLLLDIDAGKAWWRKNGTAISGDPVAGTGAMATFTPGTTLFIAADPYVNASALRLRTNPSEMTGPSVSGFTDGWPN